MKLKWINAGDANKYSRVVPDNSWINDDIDTGNCLVSNGNKFVVSLESAGSNEYLTSMLANMDDSFVFISYKGTGAVLTTDGIEWIVIPFLPCIGVEPFKKSVIVWGYRDLACISSIHEIHYRHFEAGDIEHVGPIHGDVLNITITLPWNEREEISVRLPTLLPI